MRPMVALQPSPRPQQDNQESWRTNTYIKVILILYSVIPKMDCGSIIILLPPPAKTPILQDVVHNNLNDNSLTLQLVWNTMQTAGGHRK